MTGYKKCTVFFIFFIAIILSSLPLLKKQIFKESANYQMSGEIKMGILDSNAKIVRDTNNVPYIYAKNEYDALRAQGFAMAQDRIIQMHLMRSAAAGRMSEIAGEDGLEIDKKARRLGFYKAAKAHVKKLDRGQIRFLEAFRDGVNEFLRNHKSDFPIEISLAGIEMRPWEIEDSVAIMYLMGWNSAANLESERLSYEIIQSMGYKKYLKVAPFFVNPDNGVATKTSPLLFDVKNHDRQEISSLQTEDDSKAQLKVGSNAWAVSSENTKSGQSPMLANDPHLDGRILPGVFYPTSLIMPDRRLVGTTVPGIPGVLNGRNKNISVGFTNAYGDTQDVFLLKIDKNKTDSYVYNNHSQSVKYEEHKIKVKDDSRDTGFREETFQVGTTQFGPILGEEDGYFKVVRWTAYENMKPRLGIDYLFRSKNYSELLNNLKDLTFIQLNMLYADKEDNIGFHVTGRFPERSFGNGNIPIDVTKHGDPWKGFKDFKTNPSVKNPSSGKVANANQNTTPANYEGSYSNYFSPNYRYNRIVDLLDSRKQHSAKDFYDYQTDVFNPLAERLVPSIIKALEGNPKYHFITTNLRNWDYRETVDSKASTIFRKLYKNIAKATFKKRLDEDILPSFMENWYFWQHRFEKIFFSSALDNKDPNPVSEEHLALIRKVADEFLKEAPSLESVQPLGNAQKAQFVHPFGRKGINKMIFEGMEVHKAGSGETLNRAVSPYSDVFEPKFMQTMRMVVDLNDSKKVIAILNGGVTGRAGSPYFYDQLLKMNGKSFEYWWFDDDSLKKNTKDVLFLRKNDKNVGKDLGNMRAI